MSTAYIAGKVNKAEERIAQIKQVLEKYGFTVPYDWTKNVVAKPFENHPEKAAEAALAMLRAVGSSDLLVVLYDDDLLGAHIETGFGFAAAFLDGKMVIIVGEKSDRSIFYFLPGVRRAKTDDEFITIMEELYGSDVRDTGGPSLEFFLKPGF